MREAVRGVAEHFPTAIVTGRRVEKVTHAHSSVSAEPHCTRIVHQRTYSFFAVQVCSFVGLSELYYAGSHGMDIKGPSSNVRSLSSLSSP